MRSWVGGHFKDQFGLTICPTMVRVFITQALVLAVLLIPMKKSFAGFFRKLNSEKYSLLQ